MINLKDKTVLITGARGFLGKHVVKRFENSGAELLTPTHSQLDLLAANSVRLFLIHKQPDIVVHLAANCGGIGYNQENSGKLLYDNLMMTTNLIEWCSRFGPARSTGYSNVHRPVKKFVGLGSVCSYPKHTPVPFKEDDLYNGYPEETNAPYGLAKRAQLEMLKAYRKQYGFNGIFLIPVNMAGEFDHFEDHKSHVIPALIKKFHDAKIRQAPTVTLWGDGSASREFINAADVAEAIYLATIHYNGDEPVNIGTGKEITIRDLADKISDLVGYKGDIVWDESKPNGQPRRSLDVSKAKEYFGFEAKTSLEVTLFKAYEYYKNEVA